MPKISSYPNASTPLAGTEVLLGNQGGVTKKFTTQSIANLAPATGTIFSSASISNVVINDTNDDYNLCSLTLQPGKYCISGNLTANSPDVANSLDVYINDGITFFTSASATVNSASGYVSIGLVAVISLAVQTVITLTAQASFAGTVTIYKNAITTGHANATIITATKVA